MFKFNKVFLYFLIITVVGSLFTYKIVAKAYDNATAVKNIFFILLILKYLFKFLLLTTNN